MTSRGERGSATIYAAIFIGFLTVVALVAATVSSLLVARRTAAAAADLAALAGAADLRGGGPGCVAAADITERNHATMVGCEVDGDVLTVRVSTRVRSVFRSSFEVQARARAGPAP